MARPRKLPPGLWKRGATYYARFRANGRMVRRKLSTDFDAACEILNELKARANKSDFDLIDNDYPWDDLKVEYLKWKRQTCRNASDYATDLGRFEQYSRVRSVRQITPEYVVGYREWRLEQPRRGKAGTTVTPRTVNREVGTLRNMLNMAVTCKRIGSNPIKGIKPLRHDAPTKARRALSVTEVEALFKNSPPHLRHVWQMFMLTGIRRDELVKMRFADVDHNRRIVTVQASTAKNHKAREIPLDDDTLAAIKAMEAVAKQRQAVPGKTPAETRQQEANLSRDHVFVTRANTPWRNNLLRAFYAVCKRADIEGAEPGGTVDIHSLRVSFTTLSLEGGASPKAVQAILGHSTLALTMGVYAKATERAKRDAIGALPFAGKMAAPAGTIEFPVPKAHTASTSSGDSTQPVAIAKVAG